MEWLTKLSEMRAVNKIELQIFEHEDFVTIWIFHMASHLSSPLGKHWKRLSTAKKWAEKMKREYEEQGFTVTITVLKPQRLHIGVIKL